MIIDVLMSGRAKLRDPHDFSRLRVDMQSPAHGVPARLPAGIELVSATEVWIDFDVLLYHVDEPAGDNWRSQLDAMIAVARGAGWVSTDGRVKAHVQWEALWTSSVDGASPLNTSAPEIGHA